MQDILAGPAIEPVVAAAPDNQFVHGGPDPEALVAECRRRDSGATGAIALLRRGHVEERVAAALVLPTLAGRLQPALDRPRIIDEFVHLGRFLVAQACDGRCAVPATMMTARR